LAAALLLALTGACILLGALLHPRIPPQVADQMRAIASSRLWVPAHWLLTVGQAAAVPVLALTLRQAARRMPPLAAAGAAALGLGLAVGMLGTLLAATGLRAEAERGNLGAFGAVAHFDLGLGWMCLLLAGAGGLVLGLHVPARPRAARWMGWAGASVSFALLAAAILVPYDHWWTHQYVLRSGALALGAGALALGVVWPFLSKPAPPGPA
jgi:hypothetical protein